MYKLYIYTCTYKKSYLYKFALLQNKKKMKKSMINPQYLLTSYYSSRKIPFL